MPDWLPFVLLVLSGSGLAVLALVEAHRVTKHEWSEEREATRRLRLIQGEGADVHPFRRTG